MAIQDGFLEWAQGEGRADGIAECAALLTAFSQPGEHGVREEFKRFVVAFKNAAAGVYAAEFEHLRAVEEHAVKFRAAIKSMTDIPSHARVEYRELDEVFNGLTPESDTRPPAAGGPVSNGAAAANAAAPDSTED